MLMNEKTIAKDTYKVRVGRIRRTDFLLFCLAPFFIFNPDIAIIDFLPDFIGYIMMLIPLRKLRDVNDRFDDAKKQIWIALLINAAKYGALFLSFGAIGSKEGGSASSLMMFSLVFAILDIIFVTYAFRTFFDAMQKAGERYDNTAVTGNRQKKKKGALVPDKRNRTDRIKRSTCIFIVAKALCYALPEFSTNTAHTIDDTIFDWSKFTALFRVFGVMVSIVFGIIWLCRAVAYFARVFGDRAFISAMDEDYRARAQSFKTKFILRNTYLLVSAFSVALFLCMDVYVYEKSINILSDVIAAAVMLIAFLLAYSLFRENKRLRVLLPVTFSLWLAVSFVLDVLRYSFFSKYTMYVYERNPDAYSLYTVLEAVSVADAVLFCVAVLAVCEVINYINNEYAVSKLSLENESILRMKDNERREYRRSYVTPVKICAVISAIFSAAYPFMLTLTTLKIPDTDDKFRSAEYMLVNMAKSYWFIDLIATLVLAILVCRALSALKDRAENNLMLE